LLLQKNPILGVLILSQFAGASQELYGAIIINPYDVEASSDAIKLALELPEDLQMRGKLIRSLVKFEQADAKR
jgi:trehalose 6-phosphate synthase